MNTKMKLYKSLITLVIAFSGVGLLWWDQGPLTALGVFLVIWGHNCEHHWKL